MPFHEAAEGVDDAPLELDAQPASEGERAQARAMLRMLLGAWNVLVPMAKPWWLRCQVFSDPQQRALEEVWEPYAVKYLGAVEPLYVALLATAGIFQVNISAARESGEHAQAVAVEDEPEEAAPLEDMEYAGADDAPQWPEDNPTAQL